MRIDQEKCLGCQRCADYCPVGAIQYFPDQVKPKKKKARIDEVICSGCGFCAAICPSGAILREEAVLQ